MIKLINMKKNVIIISAVLIAISLIVFSVINRNDTKTNEMETLESNDVAMTTEAKEKTTKRIFTDFIYDVGPRFNHIKKSDLDKVKSFDDFIEDEFAQRIVEYKSVSVIIMKGDKKSDIREDGKGGDLIESQLKFMQSLDYSTNFTVWADLKEKNKETGKFEHTHWTPYLTIVPEKQADYIEGADAIKTFLKDNSKAARESANVDPEKFKPAKLYFTVTKTGTIENVRLDRSCNYPLVDKAMIELISSTTGKWMPAESLNGEKVDQELVVSFGLMGC